MILTNSAVFTIVPSVPVIVQIALPVIPGVSGGTAKGRLVHPTLGPYDYQVKPDSWVNIDESVIIKPVWASTRTMTSAANVLWNGSIRDTVCEENWKALGGLAMPISQFRMLLMILQNPMDPAVDYVKWYPNYITERAYNVLPFDLQVGGQGIELDDVINYKDANGDNDGWVTQPVKMLYKIVGEI